MTDNVYDDIFTDTNPWHDLPHFPEFDEESGRAYVNRAYPDEFKMAVHIMLTDDNVHSLIFDNTQWEGADYACIDGEDITGRGCIDGAWEIEPQEASALLFALQAPSDEQGVPRFPDTWLGHELRAVITSREVCDIQFDELNDIIAYECGKDTIERDYLDELITTFNYGMQGLQWDVIVYEPNLYGKLAVVVCEARSWGLDERPLGQIDSGFIHREYREGDEISPDTPRIDGYSIRATARGWWENPVRRFVKLSL